VNSLSALLVEDTGLIDYPAVCMAIRKILENRGCAILCGTRVKSGTETTSEIVVQTNCGELKANYYVAAAGLYSDRLLASFGHSPPCRIIPFRGEYFLLKSDRSSLCQSLIYPVPNPKFPFLGVHFTRGIDDTVECGPNAVLALAREGYGKLSFNPTDALDSLSFGGLYGFLGHHWKDACFELMRSLSKRLFCAALKELIPEITLDDLVPGSAGVRAQAMLPDGKLVDDFLWFDTPRGVHVLNAPSPAATSAFSIGETITARIIARLFNSKYEMNDDPWL
jgi:L-2-hydroxyglutarate oxidase